MSGSSSVACVKRSSEPGYECEYRVFQDEGIYDEPGIVWDDDMPTPLAVGQKLVYILFKAKFLLQKLPAQPPPKTLGIVHQHLVVPLRDIQEEAYADYISLMFTHLLNLPPQHHRTVISQLADAAVSLFARPENSHLLYLPLHFSACITTLQQEGEHLDATLARAIAPLPSERRLYQEHLRMARRGQGAPHSSEKRPRLGQDDSREGP